MSFESALHPRGHDGRFTSSFTRKLTEHDRSQGNTVMDGFTPTKLSDAASTKTFFAAHKPKLSAAQRGVVDTYTGDGFFRMNKELRAGNDSDPAIKRLDSAMQPLPEDLMLTRTVGLEAFGKVNPEDLAGSLVNDAAYASTSAGPGAYGGGLSGVTMHIVAPKGTPAVLAATLSRNPGEGEVILDRGTSMAVAKVVKNQYGGYDMYMIVLPGDHSPATTLAA